MRRMHRGYRWGRARVVSAQARDGLAWPWQQTLLMRELVARRDDEARPGSDVVAERPASVLSGRTLDEVLRP
jgi:hypothetical protein